MIGIVLKEGIKVEVSKKMEKWAAQELHWDCEGYMISARLGNYVIKLVPP